MTENNHYDKLPCESWNETTVAELFLDFGGYRGDDGRHRVESYFEKVLREQLDRAKDHLLSQIVGQMKSIPQAKGCKDTLKEFVKSLE